MTGSGRERLAPAIPHVADRRLRVAWAKAPAIPAAVVKAWRRRAVPVRPAGVIAPRAVALDLLRRAHAGQEAITGNGAVGVVPLLFYRRRRCRAGKRQA